MLYPDWVLERLEQEREIDPVTNCWLWQGTIDNGYGRIMICYRVYRVHRVAFEVYVAKPKDLVLHKCGVKHCFNPAHLYDGSTQDNSRDWAETNPRRF